MYWKDIGILCKTEKDLIISKLSSGSRPWSASLPASIEVNKGWTYLHFVLHMGEEDETNIHVLRDCVYALMYGSFSIHLML